MSQRAAESFVPFDPFPAGAARPSDGRPSLKVVGKVESGPAFAPLQSGSIAHAHSPAQATASTKPVVTLEREGDRITTIRIECVCGQVIELACSY